MPRLRRYARCRVHDAGGGDDLVQTTLERALSHWQRERPEDAALTPLWAADRDALRKRFAAVLDETIPPALLRTVQRHWHGHRPTRQTQDSASK